MSVYVYTHVYTYVCIITGMWCACVCKTITLFGTWIILGGSCICESDYSYHSQMRVILHGRTTVVSGLVVSSDVHMIW